jgi:hypothetical protein
VFPVGTAMTYTRRRKAIAVTGRRDIKGCDMFRIPHRLDNLLRDGGEIMSLTRRPCSTLQTEFSASDDHFTVA